MPPDDTYPPSDPPRRNTPFCITNEPIEQLRRPPLDETRAVVSSIKARINDDVNSPWDPKNHGTSFITGPRRFYLAFVDFTAPLACGAQAKE